MKNIITILLVLFTSISYSQTIQVGEETFDIKNVVSTPTLDSVGINADLSTLYNFRVAVEKQRTIILAGANEPSTQTVIDTVVVPYITAQEINSSFVNSISNIFTGYSRSLYDTYELPNVISTIIPLNGFPTLYGKPTVVQQWAASYSNRVSGYWQLNYNASTVYFNVEDGVMTQIEKVPGQDSVQVVNGGQVGNIIFAGPSFLRITGLGVGTLNIGCKYGEEGERYATELNARIEFFRLPERFQNFPISN